ncbi:MAG: phosphoribosylformylglycinamidine cyclo-ligase [Bacteroidetes bacterium]|nr:MAG: phosphoribosylformylglycinamidine cyclo-ligase [Bacteroidota bacterium]
MTKKSGVDIDLGNKSSEKAYNYAIGTFKNRQGKKGAIGSKSDGGFSNLILFGKERIGIGSDGIGTKAELAERTGIYDTLGYDLVAMVADDLAAVGFEPTNLSNVIDVDYLDPEIIEQLMKGLSEACDVSGITITGGEIAELGDRIGGFGDKMHFNWSSTAIGVLPEQLDDSIDGHKIKPGQVVLSLKSRGFRSNGFSSVRRIMKEQFGDDWHNQAYDDNRTWGEILLTPSLVYSPLITKIIQSDLNLYGIAHITGGGIFDNFRRVLKQTNYGARFDNVYEPLPFMSKVQKLGNISDDDAYLWWNMGNGMLLVCDDNQADSIIALAKAQKYECKKAGVITEDNSIEVRLKEKTLKKEY